MLCILDEKLFKLVRGAPPKRGIFENYIYLDPLCFEHGPKKSVCSFVLVLQRLHGSYYGKSHAINKLVRGCCDGSGLVPFAGNKEKT